jgi:hypothetical protein
MRRGVALGLQGSARRQEIIFTRYNLIVVPAKPSRGTLRDLIFSDDLAKASSDIEQYMAADENSGFTPKLEFTLGDDGKVYLASALSVAAYLRKDRRAIADALPFFACGACPETPGVRS